jgi:hypothetical protein
MVLAKQDLLCFSLKRKMSNLDDTADGPLFSTQFIQSFLSILEMTLYSAKKLFN